MSHDEPCYNAAAASTHYDPILTLVRSRSKWPGIMARAAKVNLGLNLTGSDKRMQHQQEIVLNTVLSASRPSLSYVYFHDDMISYIIFSLGLSKIQAQHTERFRRF